MTCAEFKDQVAALALDALEPAERAACEAHLDHEGPHDGCEGELARAQETAAAIAMSLPATAARPELWDRIAAEIRADAAPHSTAARTAARARIASAARPGRDGRDGDDGQRAGGTRRGSWREAAAWSLAVAAAAIAFVMGVERRKSEERLGESQRELARTESVDQQKQLCLNELAAARVALRQKAAAIQLIEDPGTRLVQLAAQGGVPYRASAIVNPTHGNAMVLAHLPPQAGKDYQLWLIRGQEKISAGILPTDPSGATVVPVPRDLLADGAPDAFAVTIEPTGGMPQPTGPIVLVGAMPKTL